MPTAAASRCARRCRSPPTAAPRSSRSAWDSGAPIASDSARQNLRFLASNRAFHLAIAEATSNDRLRQSIATLHDEMIRLLNLGLFSSGREPDAMRIDYELQHKQHDALIEAFAACDPSAAERVPCPRRLSMGGS